MGKTLTDEEYQILGNNILAHAEYLGARVSILLVPAPSFIKWKLRVTQLEQVLRRGAAAIEPDTAQRKTMDLTPRQAKYALRCRTAWAFWNSYSV